jgi:transcription elongation factor Elf1
MDQLFETDIACPYCGEANSAQIDESIEEQNYVEDCQVCCRPIEFQVTAYPGEEPRVEVRREDD